MGLSTWFGFNVGTVSRDSQLPDIFALSIQSDLFVNTDVVNVYSKILTDCIERTQGLNEDIQTLLWDNCLQNQSPDGLITLLARAMADKGDLFLIYIESLNLLREATEDEADIIEEDYISKGGSDLGVFISFKNYHRSDMVRLYSAMEYCVVASLNKMMNLSKSIQFKMSDMRGSVSLSDSSVAIDQAKAIACSLRDGKDVMMDGKDEIFTNAPDISSIKESIAFLDAKKCFYYGMPLSYINGEQTTGIGSTGEADTKAVERGLKQYFISILKPVIEALFDIQVSFKSNDFRQIGSAIEALKTFDLVSDELFTKENKQTVLAKLFDIQAQSE